MKTTMLLLFVCIALSLAAEAVINVTYTGFTAEQEAAFEAGVALWEPILNSDVPIKINARFQTLSGFTIVTIPNLIRNFAGAPEQNVWYPTSLANALTGTELNIGEADVDFFINSNEMWYYGLDGQCPGTSYDFITQIFKAVPYGLGYMSSFYISQGYGSYGMLDPGVLGLTTSFPWEQMQNQPTLYDNFVCNINGQFLTDTTLYPNPSPNIAGELTGGNLRYEGTLGNAYNNDEQPILYASVFNLARTARLRQDDYQSTENSSGVPSTQAGSVLRYPAPIVMGMLEDMGWDLSLSSLRLPPANFVAVGQNDGVLLTWDAPATIYDIHNYLIFRNDVLLTTTTGRTFVDTEVENNTEYTYAVRARYSMGVSALSDPSTVELTAVDDNTITPVNNLALQVYPNPFSSNPQISFKLSTTQNLRLDVYNTKGKAVFSQNLGIAQAGTHNTVLKSFSCSNNLPAGIYFLKLQSDNQTAIKKVLMIK